jgi:hypothetical protein
MKNILLILALLAFVGCSDDKNCADELALVTEVEIAENENDISLIIIYGTSGCEHLKRVDEMQTDSIYELSIIKCNQSRNNPDIVCPDVWIEDTLFREVKIDLESVSSFKIIINDSLYKEIKGKKTPIIL